MEINNNFIPISKYLAFNIGQNLGEQYGDIQQFNNSISVMAACESGCSGSCSGGCSGSCSGGCFGSCSGGCSGSCKSTCKGTCSGGCKDGCKSSCKGNCNGTCSGGCEGVCTDYCQTYCEKQQTFSKNNYTGHPSNSGKTFTWSSSVGTDKTISISAEDWNTLVKYVNSAAAICIGGNTNKKAQTATQNKPITAAIFNSMSERLSTITDILTENKTGKTKSSNSSIIYASDFSALRTGFNNAKIKSSLGKCCQLGQTTSYNSSLGCADGQHGNP